MRTTQIITQKQLDSFMTNIHTERDDDTKLMIANIIFAIIKKMNKLHQ